MSKDYEITVHGAARRLPAESYRRDACLLPFFMRKRTICVWKYPFVVLVQSDNQRVGKSANQ